MQPLDEVALLALNAAHERETGPLDATAWRRLRDQAFHVGAVDGGATAFLLALDQEARYDSPNFRWFQARFARFVYVDRVIVSPAARGRGLGRRLYMELFARAAAAGHEFVACEVNVRPPNPTSDAFHAALGFREVGRAEIAGGAKAVAYYVRDLGGACAPG
ncbi:MAG: GNAT family N-acetyltransferase [Proteobacteria bacterium]|nr:GNAT family N-acetyltransferase [Pseudomonadota bacterium]